MATRHHCDGCQKGLDPKKDIYYSVQELSKHVPKKPYKVIFKDRDTEIKTEDDGWVAYTDLDFCPDCIKLPFDLWVHFNKGDDNA